MSLSEAFRNQSVSCARLGSPFMGKLCALLADHWPADSRLGQRVAQFQGNIGPSGHSIPLRVAGGLHALVLTGRAPELRAVYPPQSAPDATLKSAVLTALGQHQDFLLDWIESPPQTNEVRRSAALIAGAAVLGTHVAQPIWLSELGASGGLNLYWDQYGLQAAGSNIGPKAPVLTLRPDWDGPPPPPGPLPNVAARAGVDLNPLDPARPDDLLRLTAFLWPDQPDRLALTRAAASVMRAEIARADAIQWLETRLAEAPEGHTHLVQHTVAWQYFPQEAQDRGRALIEAAGARATPDRPLAWLSMESDGDNRGDMGATLTLRLWPGDLRFDLGRADFHGRWINWQGAA